MPSHKADLKNTKQKKVRLVYDNAWEHDFQKIRKFVSNSGRGVSFLAYSRNRTDLDMIEPGSWRYRPRVSVLHEDGLNSRGTEGRGRSPEAAFRDWWRQYVTDLPEGALLFISESEFGGGHKRGSILRPFLYFPGRSRFMWMDPIKTKEIQKV